MYFLLCKTITSLPDKTCIDECADIESPIESHGKKSQSPIQIKIPQTSTSGSEQSWTSNNSPAQNQQKRKSWF